MSRPSWVELMGRHAASAALYLSGEMRYPSEVNGELVERRFTFWHGPAQRWSIADQHGVRYVRTGTGDEFLQPEPGDDFVRLGGRYNLVNLGDFSPLDLIAPDSLTDKMSTELGVLTTPAEIHVADRPAWTVDLGNDATRISLVFDDATGVITQMLNPDSDVFPLEVLTLEEHTSLPETTFAEPKI